MNKHPRSSSTWIYRRKPPTCSIHHIITDDWGAQRGKKKKGLYWGHEESLSPSRSPPPLLLYPTLLFLQFMSCAHKTQLTLLEATATPRWAFKETVQKHTDLNLVHGGLGGGGINEGRATFRAQFWGVTRQMQWRGTCRKKERKVSRDGGK